MLDKVEIDKDEYDELVSDQRFLNALFSAGVDNWDGYEEAQRRYEEES